MQKVARLFGILYLTLIGASLALAMGRRPADDKDRFPDYNRIELRPSSTVQSSTTPVNAAETSPATPRLPTAKTPPGLPADDFATPKPPPKAVPMASPDDSEPPLDLPVETQTSTATAPSPSSSSIQILH